MQEIKIIQAYHDYIDLAQVFINKAIDTLNKFDHFNFMTNAAIAEIKMYLNFAMLEVDQIRRRVIKGAKIPNDEKIFSIFEEHTEWISKGKAGVPVEFGLKVCIIVDQYGFILHHRIMQNETDNKIAIPIIDDTHKDFLL